MAAKVFGPVGIGWNLVKIYDGGRPGSNETRTYEWGGDIYFPGGAPDDFSLIQDAGQRYTLIHELTHVWQHQSGVRQLRTTRLQRFAVKDKWLELLNLWENIKDDPTVPKWIKERIYQREEELDEYHSDAMDMFMTELSTYQVDPYVTPVVAPTVVSGQTIDGDIFAHTLSAGTGTKRRSEIAWNRSKAASKRFSSREDMVSKWQRRERSDYDYLKKKLSEIDFYKLNVEQQAQLVGEYFLLLEGNDIQDVFGSGMSGKARPPLAFFKAVVPFARLGTAY